MHTAQIIKQTGISYTTVAKKILIYAVLELLSAHYTIKNMHIDFGVRVKD